MQTDWLRYIINEQLPGLDDKYLKKDLNFSDVPNKVEARKNLGVYSKDEANAAFVDITGDTMTGPLTTPRVAFKAGNTDFAYIEASSPSEDKTFFDFSFGDNFGDKGTTGVDVIRFRFTPAGAGGPSSGQPFSLVEIHADTASSAWMEVAGTVWARKIISNGDILAGNGAVASATAWTSGQADFAQLNSRSNITVQHSGRTAYYQENGDVSGSIWGDGTNNGSLKQYIDSRQTTSAGLGQERGWFKDEKTGYIHQWAVGQWKGYNDESFDTIVFPIPFPSECLSVNVGLQLERETNKADGFGQVAGWNNTSCRACVQWPSGGASWEVGMRTIIWAVGR
ncbi:putative tail fiber protein [Serratia phage vB_SmaM-ChuuTotoro]|nr:putative tail fiber protein [Serratia phage vB_SmaM-ChuuTotoro]